MTYHTLCRFKHDLLDFDEFIILKYLKLEIYYSAWVTVNTTSKKNLT